MDADPITIIAATAVSLIGVLVSTVGFLIVRVLNKVEGTMDSFHKRLLRVEEENAQRRGYDLGYQQAHALRSYQPGAK